MNLVDLMMGGDEGIS